jgi:hypothetical protein
MDRGEFEMSDICLFRDTEESVTSKRLLTTYIFLSVRKVDTFTNNKLLHTNFKLSKKMYAFMQKSKMYGSAFKDKFLS